VSLLPWVGLTGVCPGPIVRSRSDLTEACPRRWENAAGLGRHLSQWLLARGEVVLDVPPSATRRVRELSRGGGRKNGVIDAAAAGIAAAQGDARP